MRKLAVVMSLVVLAAWGMGLVLAQEEGNCPANFEGFLAPRLLVGTRGVVVPGGTGNRVRAEPNAGAEQVGMLVPGTEFEILAGPSCDAAASIIWWQVRAEDGLEGWTAEGLLPADYFLEPVAASMPTLTPSVTPSPTLTPTPQATRPPASVATRPPASSLGGPSAVAPTPIVLPGLDLPELAALSPENVPAMSVVGRIPTTGSAESVFFSPGMAYLFTLNVAADRTNFANVYTFPDLRPVAQRLPLEGTNGHGSLVGTPIVLFTPDGRLMVSVNYGFEDAILYTPGAGTYSTDFEQMRVLRVADLSAEGILALGYGSIIQDTEPQLCLIDLVGAAYVPADRLCLARPSGMVRLAFLADGARLLVATRDALDLLDVRTGETLQSFDYGIILNGTLAILPGSDADGRLPTVFLSREGFVLSADLQTGEERTYASGQGQVAREISFSPDGTQLILVALMANDVPAVLVVDVATKAVLHQDVRYGGEGLAYSPDGALAFINNVVYETGAWQSLTQLRGDQHILGFAPDGTLLLVWNTSDHVFELYGVPG